MTNTGHVLRGTRMSTSRDGRSASLGQREESKSKEIDGGGQQINGFIGHLWQL